MKILRVGDPHVKPNNIKESEALIRFVLDKALEFKVDKLELLGDLFDTHGIVRLEVLEFWHKWFACFAAQDFKTVVLVGNHDVTGNYSSEYSALHPFIVRENGVFKIVHKPYLDGVYGYLPYIHNNDDFIKEANKLAEQGAKVIVSHPNFEGAVYDNGSPITSGVDPSLISDGVTHLIGGHIHTELELGRVWYTGNPRWLTKSCSNKRKGIWLCEHDDSGTIQSKTFISTESVCTPIVGLVWKEGEEKPTIPSNANVNIELVGSSDWVSKQKLELRGQVSISSKITDTKKSKERKSGKSLYEFLSKYYQTDPEKREKLISYMKGLEIV
jgi:DNA repair exonuclease SbcCD nuclease subunit